MIVNREMAQNDEMSSTNIACISWKAFHMHGGAAIACPFSVTVEITFLGIDYSEMFQGALCQPLEHIANEESFAVCSD